MYPCHAILSFQGATRSTMPWISDPSIEMSNRTAQKWVNYWCIMGSYGSVESLFTNLLHLYQMPHPRCLPPWCAMGKVKADKGEWFKQTKHFSCKFRRKLSKVMFRQIGTLAFAEEKAQASPDIKIHLDSPVKATFRKKWWPSSKVAWRVWRIAAPTGTGTMYMCFWHTDWWIWHLPTQ